MTESSHCVQKCERTSGHRFPRMVWLKFWAGYTYVSTSTIGSQWSPWVVMAAHHCYLWWRWWSDTLWATLIRLWLHSLLCCHQIVVVEICLQFCRYMRFQQYPFLQGRFPAVFPQVDWFISAPRKLSKQDCLQNCVHKLVHSKWERSRPMSWRKRRKSMLSYRYFVTMFLFSCEDALFFFWVDMCSLTWVGFSVHFDHSLSLSFLSWRMMLWYDL